MIYLRRDNPRRKLSPHAIVALLFAFIILALTFFSPNALTGLFTMIARPLWGVGQVTTDAVATTAPLLLPKSSLVAQNKALREELATAQNRLLTLDTVIAENDELRALLGRVGTSTSILGYVMRTVSASPYNTILIDVGQAAGVKPQDVVMVDGVLPIGDVAEVYEKHSVVRLYSSPGQETEVVIQGQNIHAVASGRGGGNFEVKIPRDLTVEKGTLITLPGGTGLVIGRVESVDATAADSLQTILFRTPVNLSEIHRVIIFP